jgi:hypothetical protein
MNENYVALSKMKMWEDNEDEKVETKIGIMESDECFERDCSPVLFGR